MNKVTVTELGYIGIGVKDLSAWRTFASDILGMEYCEVDGAAKLRMDYWHYRILLQPHQDDDLLRDHRSAEC
jgi:2,3-dihydroxyethylbenzene 1,2-dioxygenase